MTQELIPVEKDGEYIEVNPVALEQHKQLGWKETEKRDIPDEVADEPAEKPAKAGKGKKQDSEGIPDEPAE